MIGNRAEMKWNTVPTFPAVTILVGMAGCDARAQLPGKVPEEASSDLFVLEQVAATSANNLHLSGVITDAAADRKGLVYIVDPMVPGIVVTDSELDPRGHFGRSGGGPGEFRDPVSVGVVEDSLLAVLDRALGRVLLLRVSGEAGLQSAASVSLPIAPEALCVVGKDSLLVYGFHKSRRLHLYTKEGRLVRSFAPVDSLFSPMALDLLTRGRIACDAAGDEVLISSRFLPTIEAFAISTGERVWTDSLRPFRPVGIQDRGGAVTISSERAGFSLVSSQFHYGDHRIFQTVYESRRDDVEADTVVTYVFSRQQEKWLPPQYHLPLLFPVGTNHVLSIEAIEGKFDMLIGLNRLVINSP